MADVETLIQRLADGMTFEDFLEQIFEDPKIFNRVSYMFPEFSEDNDDA